MSHKAHLCSPTFKGKLHRQINDRDHTEPAPPYQTQPFSSSEAVHSWLKQAPKPSHDDSLRDNHIHGGPNYNDRPSWRPHGLPLARTKPNHREELDYHSSNLFAKDTAESIASSPDKDNYQEYSPNFRHGNNTHERKRRSERDVAHPPAKGRLFEKRSRHKTRDDRYKTRNERGDD